MNDEAIKTAIGRFLKTVNFTAAGKLQGGETLTASVTLANEQLGLNITIFSKLEL
jgi:hypothetical protein